MIFFKDLPFLTRFCSILQCDMYSLGIVLFEMFHPFHTGMERVKCLDLLRKGDIPECIRQRWPIASECILDLTQEDPLQRPSANQLLQGHLFVSKDEVRPLEYCGPFGNPPLSAKSLATFLQSPAGILTNGR